MVADRRVCLMQDPVYRAEVAHRSMGYEQSPVPGYYLGVSPAASPPATGRYSALDPKHTTSTHRKQDAPVDTIRRNYSLIFVEFPLIESVNT